MRTLISLEGAEWKAGVVVDKDNSDSKEYHLRKLGLHRQTSPWSLLNVRHCRG